MQQTELEGPSWARDDTDFLADLHSYIRLAKSKSLRYKPDPYVTDGDLVAWKNVSASQIENFEKCKRLWFFKSVLKFPEVQKGNQALGSAFHKIAEVVENAPVGQLPRAGYEYNYSDIALDAAGWQTAETLASFVNPIIPRSTSRVSVLRETKIVLPTYDNGPTLIGYVDLAIPPGIGWPELMIPREAAIIGDYKTLSDFRYMKTPAELATSVQMMTYAKWAISDAPATSDVYLAHIYARTKAPFSAKSIRNSVACVSSTQINAKWNQTLDVIKEMDYVSTASDAQDVEATGILNNHCGAYGGCSFRDKCGLNAPNPVSNLFSIQTKPQASPTESNDMTNSGGSSILAKIQAARAAAAGNPAPVQAPEPVAAPVQAPETPAPVTQAAKAAAPGPVSGLLAQIALKHNQARPSLTGLVALLYSKEQNLQTTAGATLLGSGELANVVCKSMPDLVNLANGTQIPNSGIISHDAPPRTQKVITTPGDGVDPIKANSGAVPTRQTVPVLDDSEDEDEPAQAPANDTKRRGRPSKEETEAKKAAEKAELEADIERRVQERLAASGSVDSGALVAELQDYKEALAQAETSLGRALQERKTLEGMINASQVGLVTNTQKVGLVLYVDCYPVKGGHDLVDFLEWYAPIAAAVAQANNVADWRLISYTSKGLLAAFMREALKDNVPHAMTIQQNAPGADVALEVLSPIARQIIRRF